MRLKTPKTQANPTTSFARRSRLLFIAPPLSGASRAHWSTNRNVARLARVPEPAAGLTLVLLGGALLLGSRDRSGGQAHHDHRGTYYSGGLGRRRGGHRGSLVRTLATLGGNLAHGD